MSDKIYIGADNGLGGGFAVIGAGGAPLFFATPITSAGKDNIVDAGELQFWFTRLGRMAGVGPLRHVGLELGQKNPKFGAKGNYSQGDSNATIRTVLVLLGIPFTLIVPQTWQKEMHMGVRGAGMDTKTASFEACARLFPGVSIPPLTERSKKPHDGFADALLIAEFMRRRNL